MSKYSITAGNMARLTTGLLASSKPVSLTTYEFALLDVDSRRIKLDVSVGARGTTR